MEAIAVVVDIVVAIVIFIVVVFDIVVVVDSCFCLIFRLAFESLMLW